MGGLGFTQGPIAYAEVLFDVCALLSQSPSMPPSPTLGVAGSGRFFERRLTLILHDHVPADFPHWRSRSLSLTSIRCAVMVEDRAGCCW